MRAEERVGRNQAENSDTMAGKIRTDEENGGGGE